MTWSGKYAQSETNRLLKAASKSVNWKMEGPSWGGTTCSSTLTNDDVQLRVEISVDHMQSPTEQWTLNYFSTITGELIFNEQWDTSYGAGHGVHEFVSKNRQNIPKLKKPKSFVEAEDVLVHLNQEWPFMHWTQGPTKCEGVQNQHHYFFISESLDIELELYQLLPQHNEPFMRWRSRVVWSFTDQLGDKVVGKTERGRIEPLYAVEESLEDCLHTVSCITQKGLEVLDSALKGKVDPPNRKDEPQKDDVVYDDLLCGF